MLIRAERCPREGFRGGTILDLRGSHQPLVSYHLRERGQSHTLASAVSFSFEITESVFDMREEGERIDVENGFRACSCWTWVNRRESHGKGSCRSVRYAAVPV